MKFLKFICEIVLLVMLYSCNSNNEKPVEKPIGKPQEPIDIKKDIVGFKDTLTSPESKLVMKIACNIDDPKDSLAYMTERAMGITIESLGWDASVINLWYGGSHEDILVYRKNKKGSYTRILWMAGAISFKVHFSADYGLRRLQIKNNRNKKIALFVYNGSDYSTYLDQGIRRSLKDSVGISTLREMEIYNEISFR